MSIRIVDWNSSTPAEQDALLARSVDSFTDVDATVREIFTEVARRGDDALRELTAKFDGAVPPLLFVPQSEINGAVNKIDPKLRDAIAIAKANIESFHKKQVPAPYEVETAPGVSCRREWRPIDRVGLYIPGGSAPLLSTLLMLGVPARLAGCKDIIVCSPPMKDGSVAPGILYIASLLGISNIAIVGGAQAIAAMASGTGTIKPVNKIFGPGNRFVAAAKNLVSQPPYNIAIDVQAGPTELAMIVDDSIPASWVAADLLAQAEHGPDSHVLLFTPSKRLASAVAAELKNQLESLPRKMIASPAIGRSAIILVRDIDQAVEISNRYAPEHLNIAIENAQTVTTKISNAGSVFIGGYTTAVFGDYVSGTNHTLPTAGAARYSGGVTVESFMKPIFFQSMSRAGYNQIAGTASILARAEGLEGHACSVDIRKTGREDV